MADPHAANISTILRLLPSIDELLGTDAAQHVVADLGPKRSTALAREVTDSFRNEIRENAARFLISSSVHSKAGFLEELSGRLGSEWLRIRSTRLRRVINATGVIVHTNLGRAPLSEAAVAAIAEEASGYCTLEYDIETGKRGRRGAYVESLIAELAGAESALVVNNCAAAAFLVLSVLAAGREVIVSRGELVEIGGDFRVPDVLAQSGAVLREVGTTNRTKLSDYEKAINENTGLILKVHPSNYRIVGFTAMPSVEELAELAHRRKTLLYEDAGSGAMLDLGEYGLDDEPVINRSIVAGVDVVTFSGDKLLGSAQAGLIVGREEIIDRFRKHPLYRALRTNKLVYAALEATLGAFHRETAKQEIPVLKMLSATVEELEQRTGRFAERLSEIARDSGFRFEVIRGNSVIGGGSAPTARPETVLIALQQEELSAAELERSLRLSSPPVIARIFEDKVVIDLRTVSEREEAGLFGVLTKLIGR